MCHVGSLFCLCFLAGFGLGDIPAAGRGLLAHRLGAQGARDLRGSSPSSNLCPGQCGPCRVRMGLVYCAPSRAPGSVFPAAPGAGPGGGGLLFSNFEWTQLSVFPEHGALCSLAMRTRILPQRGVGGLASARPSLINLDPSCWGLSFSVQRPSLCSCHSPRGRTLERECHQHNSWRPACPYRLHPDPEVTV